MKTAKKADKNQYGLLLEEFIEKCIQKGNRDWTIQFKRSTCEEFLCDIEEYGKNLSTLDAATVGKICTSKVNRNKWHIYKMFLHFLFEKGEIKKDISIVVPTYRERQPLPSVYSISEVRQIENAVDRTTIKGKQDYAIILLASRMGLRRSDIVGLTFETVDFVNNKIHIIQKKTEEELELPLINSVSDALLDFIGASNSSCVGRIFPDITPNYITVLVRQIMLHSEIDINGRRLGPHSLRSSLATSMVNDGVSYEIIRRILGHSDHTTVRKYAKLDIETLRQCALEIPVPTGIYKEILEGGELL